MIVDGIARRSICLNDDGWSIDVIDQTLLPHRFDVRNLRSLDDACIAISDMVVRGAPLIGVTAAYGLYLALRTDPSSLNMAKACAALKATRPTAINLAWALDRLSTTLGSIPAEQRAQTALTNTNQLADQDVTTNQAIGLHGLELIKQIQDQKEPGDPVNILTHCNAGWLATVDWGTATAPIYQAFQAGIPIHVWVDETRPRNQGSRLTAWELGHQGIPHSVIVDNLGGHLMQHQMVDLCLVGSDRTTRNGDVCNKIGTYLKALAAQDNDVPFYVCLPASTIDWNIGDGVDEIPIEQRDSREVSHMTGKLADGSVNEVGIAAADSQFTNYAFDVTPARLVTGLVTEFGIVGADQVALSHLHRTLQDREISAAK